MGHELNQLQVLSSAKATSKTRRLRNAMMAKPEKVKSQNSTLKKLLPCLILSITSATCLYANDGRKPLDGKPANLFNAKLRIVKAMPLNFNNIGKQLEYRRKQLIEGEDSARAYVKAYERMLVDDYTVTGNLYVSTDNATGGGIVLADDGDIVDMNDGFGSMRFSQGIRIYSANRGGSPVINLQSDGYIWTSVYGYLQDGFMRATGSTSQNIDGIKYFYSHKGNGVYLQSTSSPGLQAFSSDGGAAFMSFHRASQYAINMGLDPDNVFRIGGWSDGNNARMELDANGGVRFKKLQTGNNGVSLNTDLQFNEGLIIEAKTGGRSTTNGAQLEFAIPANVDGSNMWGQARIITVAGNTGDGNATGKMILGTRRMNKNGLPNNRWYYGDDLTIDGGGNVGIGTTDPGTAKLAVNGRTFTSVLSFLNTNISMVGVGGTDLLNFNANEDGTGNTLLSLNRNSGSLGIGTTNPSAKLTVEGAGSYILVNGSYSNYPGGIDQSSYKLLAAHSEWAESQGGGAKDILTVGYASNIPEVDLFTKISAWSRTKTAGSYDTKNYIAVGEGGTSYTPGNFWVKGNIKTTKVKVTQTDWADYVFAPGYKLLSLTELENYINKYNHLPDVPSAEEVAKDGLDVGDNQAILLKKIEELTLYVIEQAKRNDKLEEANKQLLNRLEKLEKNK